VADELRDRGVAVTWLGTRLGIEAELVPAHDFPICFINIQGLRGKSGIGGKIKAPFQLLRAVWQSLRVIIKVRPDVILGMGGFASGPGGVAGWIMRKPLVIHEQNGVAGTTNRILAKIATRVLESFPGSLPRAEHCGNPVRPIISKLAPPELRGIGGRKSGIKAQRRLLVLGGSLGAVALNRVIPASVALMTNENRPEILHQTGHGDLNLTELDYLNRGIEANTAAFIDDMAEAYEWADLIVCRAGALTVTELTAAGLGAVLIPYPYAIDDHQSVNARLLVDHGAAILIPQDELNEVALADLLTDLLGDADRLLLMAQAARRLSRPQATGEIADVCQQVMA
jgi:UDP-N-acetylglucosamine--N-acetylmuramyl-(pentapeptide) pyrophosphoryl-undecaprenol N-acetylglucosamine transferase